MVSRRGIGPLFTVVALPGWDLAPLRDLVELLLARRDRDWELAIVGSASASVPAGDTRFFLSPAPDLAGVLEEARGDIVCCLHPAVLSSDALLRVREAFAADPLLGGVIGRPPEMRGAQDSCRPEAWAYRYHEAGFLALRRELLERAGARARLSGCVATKRLLEAVEDFGRFRITALPVHRLLSAQSTLHSTAEGNGVSIVIPHTGDSESLLATLETMKGWSSGGVEVIVSHIGDVPPAGLTNDYPFALTIALSPGPWNLSRARNLGVAAARYRRLFFLDADISVPPNFLEVCNSRIGPNRAWFPCVKDLGGGPGVDGGGYRVFGYGQMGIFKRDFYYLRGWDELDGYGGEDVVMHWKARRAGLAVFRDKDCALIHRPHSRGTHWHSTRRGQRLRIARAKDRWLRAAGASLIERARVGFGACLDAPPLSLVGRLLPQGFKAALRRTIVGPS